MREIWPQLKAWVENGTEFATATVVEASRPSPRGIGAVLAVRADGDAFVGSVSAGCVESEVIEAAKLAMQDGKPRWLTFGPENGYPWEVALSCGGRIEVRVERYAGVDSESVGKALAESMESHERALLLSYDGRHALMEHGGDWRASDSGIPVALLGKAEAHFLRGGATVEIDWESSKALFRVLERPRRLFIIGAAHIAIHLVGFAKSLGYETIVIDPREAYARGDRFPWAPDELFSGWPGEVLKGFQIGPYDSVAAMTHDPKIDDEALDAVLKTQAGYIGALGSRKSHAARERRLLKRGIAEASLARIQAPIGLDIGSETPAEIALSVMAEIVKRRNANED